MGETLKRSTAYGIYKALTGERGITYDEWCSLSGDFQMGLIRSEEKRKQVEEQMIRNVRQSVVSGKDNEVTTIINGRVVGEPRNAVTVEELAQKLITLKNLLVNQQNINPLNRTEKAVYTKELEKLKRYLGAFDLGVKWDDTDETFVVYALDATKD